MTEFNIDNILQTLRSVKTGYLTFKQIASLVGTQSSAQRQQLDLQLKQLSQQGLLMYDKANNRYCLPQADTFVAVVDMQARGYCFLMQEGVDKDLFVASRNTNGAMHKDTVTARRIPATEDEAEIISIISRGYSEVVGVLDVSNGFRFVIADDKKFNKDIFIKKGHDLNAKHGQKVVVKITKYPIDNSHKPEGEIIQVLGYAGQHYADMLSVAFSFGIRDKFDGRVLAKADKIASTISDKDIIGRADLRQEVVITIDGEDAKDLDDAISITRLDNGNYRLGVHIADVSNYVKLGDDIDVEANLRGTSTYLPQMVFPMLPTVLSNGICSLFEKVERLTLSCNMTIDSKGDVVDFEVVDSVINSRHRMTYTDVQAILDGDKNLIEQYSDIVEMLSDMAQLAQILIDRRDRRGNIDFASGEVKFVYDKDGRVIDILPYETLFAHRIIEQFMITANETVAQYAKACDAPFMYRVHETPDPDKLSALTAILKGFGIDIPPAHTAHSSALQKALDQCKDKPFYNLVNSVMLRTMQKAKYSETNCGHYGLASACYCHFTSPIRRYPDLMVHRILKAIITGKLTDKAKQAYMDICTDNAISCSTAERRSELAERKAVDVKVCQFALTLVGNSYIGIINGVTDNGIFVQLPNTVEGFVRLDNLPGWGYVYDSRAYRLSNQFATYCLGDSIEVTIESVNVSACRIDMIPSVDKDTTR